MIIYKLLRGLVGGRESSPAGPEETEKTSGYKWLPGGGGVGTEQWKGQRGKGAKVRVRSQVRPNVEVRAAR